MQVSLERPPGKAVMLLLALLVVGGTLVTVFAVAPQHAFAASCSVTTEPDTISIYGQTVTQVVVSGPGDATCANQQIAHTCAPLGANGTASAKFVIA